MQKPLVLILPVIIFFLSCARTVEPTVENINKIFDSKDFTFEFHKAGDQAIRSFSFIDDILVYKSNKPTYRREITYAEVLLINDYIQNILNLHTSEMDPETSSYYIIKNTAYKVKIVPKQEEFYFDALLKTLKLDDI